MHFIQQAWIWLFSLQPVEQDITDPAKKLLNSMRITSKCRYSASIRLKRQSQYSFFATTLLSLGLILIPLLQNAEINLALSPKVLNMLQIFLAVAVLVYSVINATAHYETRSKALNECGDKIKDLIRNLRREISVNTSSVENIDLKIYNQKYDQISTDSENHSRVDYMFSTLEMRTDYTYTGMPRVCLYMKAVLFYLIPYTVPTLFLTLEIIFITDMLNITKIFTPYLQPESPAIS